MIFRFLTRVLEWAIIVVMAALVLDVLWGVFSRHLLHSQSGWTEELARFLLIWVGLLGASLGFGQGAHLGVDYFVGKLHPGGRVILEVTAHVVVFAFAVGVLIWGGWALAWQTFDLGQITPALGLRKGYVYLAVPVSGVFIALFTLQNIAATLAAHRAIRSSREADRD